MLDELWNKWNSLSESSQVGLLIFFATIVCSAIGYLIKKKLFEKEPNTNDSSRTHTITQTTHSGPAIAHTGSGNINIGLTLEEHECSLKRQEKKLREEIKEKHNGEYESLKFELQAVQQNLRDIHRSYEQKIINLNRHIQELNKLEKVHNDVRLVQATSELQAGNYKGADLLLQQIEEDNQFTIILVAESAYQRGQIAEDEVRYRDAIHHYEKALRLIPDKENYLDAASRIYYELGNYPLAIDLIETKLKKLIESEDENFQRIATYQNNLGELFRKIGQFDKSFSYLNKALDMTRKFADEDSLEVANIQNNLGLSWNEIGEYSKAACLFELALKKELKVYPEYHPALTRTRNNLAANLAAIGNHELAIKYYEQSLKWMKKIQPNNPDIGTLLGNLSLSWKDLRDFEKAKNYCSESLNIFLQLYGENHPDVATAQNNLGSILNSLRDYPAAIKCLESALDVMKRFFGEDHPSVAGTKNNLAEAYLNIGDFDKAYVYQEQAYNTARKILGDNHPNTELAKANLKFIQNKKNNS